MRNRVFRVATLSILALSLGACSTQSIRNLGDSILSTFGLSENRKSFSPVDTMGQSGTQFTPEQEYYVGRAVAAKVLSMYKASSDQALQKYVREVGAAVVAFSDRAETFGGYHFMVLESDEINAVAAPGGFIFITTGFIRQSGNEDTLASILAHEVGHVVHQHGLRSINAEGLTDTLLSLGQLAGSMNCGEVLIQATALLNQTVDEIVSNLLEKGYSQDQEYEADQTAFEIMVRAGFNPQGLLASLETLKQLKGSSHGGWFDTHPDPADRIAKILAQILAIHDEFSAQGRAARDARFKARVQ